MHIRPVEASPAMCRNFETYLISWLSFLFWSFWFQGIFSEELRNNVPVIPEDLKCYFTLLGGWHSYLEERLLNWPQNFWILFLSEKFAISDVVCVYMWCVVLWCWDLLVKYQESGKVEYCVRNTKGNSNFGRKVSTLGSCEIVAKSFTLVHVLRKSNVRFLLF